MKRQRSSLSFSFFLQIFRGKSMSAQQESGCQAASMAQLVQCQPNKCKALSSAPSTTKEGRKGGREGGRKEGRKEGHTRTPLFFFFFLWYWGLNSGPSP
jgi:hypothetical protein